MKPSYEELEEQLNRSRRLCDAALANERVWEIAMMQACGEDGPKSVADKFAALEQKLAESQREFRAADATIENMQMQVEKLAAVNALLKKSEPAPFSKLMMEALDVYQAGADEVPELAMLSAYTKLRDGLKTPATDSFLAEVRAQGVEMLVKHCEQKALEKSYDFFMDAGAVAAQFAAQLRQEAAQ
ncbi:hypothetical protein [Enterobacter cloacae]|uniref:hypothetical protein n=1 Tax=Enterobacter cloacae TaxID=550 RepID=UPI0031D48A22